MIASNKGPAFQRGVGLPALAAMLVLIGLIGLVSIRLVPVYLESFEIGSILSSVEGEMSGQNANHSDLRKAIDKRLRVNSIKSISRNDISFTTQRGGTDVVIAYEVRVPMFGNLDVVANFRKEALVRQ